MASESYKRQMAKPRAIEKTANGESIVITGNVVKKSAIGPWPRARRGSADLEATASNLNDAQNVSVPSNG